MSAVPAALLRRMSGACEFRARPHDLFLRQGNRPLRLVPGRKVAFVLDQRQIGPKLGIEDHPIEIDQVEPLGFDRGESLTYFFAARIDRKERRKAILQAGAAGNVAIIIGATSMIAVNNDDLRVRYLPDHALSVFPALAGVDTLPLHH